MPHTHPEGPMHNLNLTAIAIAWLGSSLVALPLLAFTARYALVPLVESVAVVRAAGKAPRSAALLEQRLAGLELGLAALHARIGPIAHASGEARAGAAPLGLAAVGSPIRAGADGGHPAH
jgi:hypothetical protein